MTAVAIDGPAGAGKSTIARRTAEQLGFLYADTGALYRAIGLAVLEEKIDPEDVPSVESLLDRIAVTLRFVKGEQRVLLNRRDVSEQIRSPEVSMSTSLISRIPEVREFLLSLQRDLAAKNNIIMDGRDIGTVVLPNARVKIFLTASVEDRARRRYEEMLQKGQQADYADVLKDLRRRDYNDTHRAVSPLTPAPDAILVDTTGNTLEQSVAELAGIIQKHLTGGPGEKGPENS